MIIDTVKVAKYCNFTDMTSQMYWWTDVEILASTITNVFLYDIANIVTKLCAPQIYSIETNVSEVTY